MSAEIVPFDWGRMFLGDVPPLFLLEIAFRTTLMFLWLVFLLRVTGKRGLAQLSPLELAIVIGLGSAAGDPMFYPEVPLLHAMLVLALVVALQRLLSHLVIHSETVETFVEGTPIELVRDGVLSRQAMVRANLSREDVFERLRAQGVRQLGQVQRLYFEQDGALTVFTHAQNPPPGLAVVPPWDLEPPRELTPADDYRGPVACLNCGQVRPAPEPAESLSAMSCTCGESRWTQATADPLGPGEPPTPEERGEGGGRGPGVPGTR
ncbi:DUF421 domain-containing protein [Deinococcus aquaedulcis]|uniref:DUF421 domain-containing protein n=1 Tax=Deinococcus aquaedulcis TaxID=2840455 RepID=UPI001C83A14E|nr:DUF421 domain-containing protein [Deinococcus aquaedulcis]